MARQEPRLKVTEHTISPQMHWVQVEREMFGLVAELIADDPKAAKLLMNVTRFIEPGSGGAVVASREALCERCGFSKATFHRALRSLTEKGWVQRMRIGSAYALVINSRFAWIGARKGIEHAIFTATVIASSTEQDAIALNPPPVRLIAPEIATMQPGFHPAAIAKEETTE